jgi:hypothetical protein
VNGLVSKMMSGALLTNCHLLPYRGQLVNRRIIFL